MVCKNAVPHPPSRVVFGLYLAKHATQRPVRNTTHNAINQYKIIQNLEISVETERRDCLSTMRGDVDDTQYKVSFPDAENAVVLSSSDSTEFLKYTKHPQVPHCK